jgi:uncharacterized membrane protein YeaQ/YmgE (transglycosylase-associated protein family)
MLTFVFVWLALGLFAGVLASRIMRGSRGTAYDALIGVVGAVAGGLLLGILIGHTANTLVGQVIVAFVGALILLTLFRLPARHRRLLG